MGVRDHQPLIPDWCQVSSTKYETMCSGDVGKGAGVYVTLLYCTILYCTVLYSTGSGEEEVVGVGSGGLHHHPPPEVHIVGREGREEDGCHEDCFFLLQVIVLMANNYL